AGLRNLKVAIIESLEVLGGQVSALYPEKNILDIAGFYGIKGQELIDNLIKQMRRFPVDVFLGTTVNDVIKNKEAFEIKTENEVFQTKSVIVATGNGSFSPRPLNLRNEHELNNFDYFIKNLEDYKNKKVVVLGGGDSAVDFALMLNKVAKEVVLVHRRDQFRALERSVEELKSSSVIVKTPLQLISAQNPSSNNIELFFNDGSDEIADKLVVAYGFTANNRIIDSWSVMIDKYQSRFATNSQQLTNIDGLFVVGDASGYNGKADLIATGFGEAPTAVNEAVNYFAPSKGGPAHSTSLNI
ncbi:MAG: NAD(P)/FAD-dependent oxidoreductase, partial [Lactobacillaceae bacterium]|nr:NAD(P)/FAD-dependent oxidoreductase [Lactobacillaceae bacterium]